MKCVTIFLSGFLAALLLIIVAFPRNVYNYKEDYITTLNTKRDIQLSFKDFYVNNYCYGKPVKHLLVKTFGTTFDGLYCEKRTVMLLDGGLPFYIETLNGRME